MKLRRRLKSISIATGGIFAISVAFTSHASAAAPWGSINLDGSNYLSSTNMSAPGTGAFTYEFWFYSTLESGGTQVLMNSRQSISTGQQKDGFDVILTTNRELGASYKNLGFFNSGVGSIAVNRWYHFALVRQVNTVYAYLNGNLVGSQLLDSDGRNLYSQRLWLGSTVNGANKFTGYISNFRYTKSDLYSSNFSLATDDFENVTNTSILLKTKNDDTFITNSIAGTTFSNVGSVTASSRNPFESNQTQADKDAAAKAERNRIEAERQVAIKLARERINQALVANESITTADLIEADLPLKSVDSLYLAYKELLSIKYALTKPLSDEEAYALKFNKFMKYAMYERMTGISNGDVFGRDLAKYGVISEDAPMKQLTTYQLMKQPLSARDSIAKVNDFYTQAATNFQVRKAHLAAIIAKIQGS